MITKEQFLKMGVEELLAINVNEFEFIRIMNDDDVISHYNDVMLPRASEYVNVMFELYNAGEQPNKDFLDKFETEHFFVKVTVWSKLTYDREKQRSLDDEIVKFVHKHLCTIIVKAFQGKWLETRTEVVL